MNRSVSVIAALGVSVAGCSKIEAWQHPEIAACEDFANAKLKAPATYKRVKTSVIDEQIPLATWDAIEADRLGKMAAEFRELTKKSQTEGGVRSVVLEYDAENGFGVPTRGTEICKFLVSSFAKNEFEAKPDASSAKLARMIWQLDANSTEEPACCLPVRQLKAIRGSHQAKDVPTTAQGNQEGGH